MEITQAQAQNTHASGTPENESGAEFSGVSMAPPAFQLKAGTPFQFQEDTSASSGVAQLNADTGNTELVTQIVGLLAGADIDAAAAQDVMGTFATMTDDRIRVVLGQLSGQSQLNPFITRVIPAAGAGFESTVTKIRALTAELANPLTGTVDADAADRTAVEGILNEGLNVDPVTGDIVAFVDVVAGRSYSQDIQDTLTREVARIYPRAVERNGRSRHGWDPYEVIARKAKEATDDLYGAYNVAGAPLTSSGPNPNLLDVRDQSYSDSSLAQFANYLVTGHSPADPIYPGQRIHAIHNADLNRAEERAILNQAITDWMSDATHHDHLNELRRSWSGVQSGGRIFIQRWDMGTDEANRRQFWDMYQTMIHEYLHKITHADFTTRARSLGRHREQIFTEGGTSYFDKRVWESVFPQEIASNAELRENVEGAAYPYDPSVIPAHHGYRQMEQFERIVGTVGEENAKAAYFNGEVDKIGMPTP